MGSSAKKKKEKKKDFQVSQSTDSTWLQKITSVSVSLQPSESTNQK